MVLGDVIDDYLKYISIINNYDQTDGFIDSALQFINNYHEQINSLADMYLKSTHVENDKNVLVKGLNNLESTYSNQIANMISSMRGTTRLITEVERVEWKSKSVLNYAQELCNELDKLMDLTEIYASNKINGKSNRETFFEMIDELNTFRDVYVKVFANHQMLKDIENELLEDMPDESEEISVLDVRSYKPDTSLESFTADLRLLADCLQHYERLVCDEPGRVIYMRKIESGSLKAVFGSNKVDFSIFPDLISSISNAIRTWRITPAERRKIEAEACKTEAEAALINAKVEEQCICNTKSKLALVNTQVEFVCDKLGITADNPEEVQKFLLPIVNYLESNPVGAFNGEKYNISNEVHLLDDK